MLAVVDPIRWRWEARATRWESLQLSPGLEPSLAEVGLGGQPDHRCGALQRPLRPLPRAGPAGYRTALLPPCPPSTGPGRLGRQPGATRSRKPPAEAGRAAGGDRSSEFDRGPGEGGGRAGPGSLARRDGRPPRVRLRSGGQVLHNLAYLFRPPGRDRPVRTWRPIPESKDMSALLRSRQTLFAEAAATGALMVMSHQPLPPFGTIVLPLAPRAAAGTLVAPTWRGSCPPSPPIGPRCSRGRM
jgi:hypothetical protein